MAEGHDNREEIFSKAVRAGKRTYFFDVKSTKANDLYLTITESKKRFHDDGKVSYEKHKLFLYKEDFEKFADGLNEAIEKIYSINDDSPTKSDEYAAKEETEEVEMEAISKTEFTDVSFEDL
ncbi:MAG: hypothetical protein ACJAUV_002094 [Flavobacteriales bacterium]|jgi:hypothetical protein